MRWSSQTWCRTSCRAGISSSCAHFWRQWAAVKRGDELSIVPTSDQYYITASGHKLNNDQPSLPVLVLNVHSAAAQISSY